MELGLLANKLEPKSTELRNRSRVSSAKFQGMMVCAAVRNMLSAIFRSGRNSNAAFSRIREAEELSIVIETSLEPG